MKLIGLIMKAVWRAAGADPLAHRELQDEEEARVIHCRLLEQPLVADLLHPRTPIAPDELTPTLLSATQEEVDGVLEMLDPNQLAHLSEQGRDLIAGLEAKGLDLGQARLRLAQIEVHLRQSLPAGRVN